MKNASTSPYPSDPISPTEAAKLLGVHVACLYRWLNANRLAWWRMPGGRIRVSKRDVLELPKPGNAGVVIETRESVAMRRTRTQQTLERYGVRRG